MRKKTYKKRKKPFPPPDPAKTLNAGSMVDEALLERCRDCGEQPAPETPPMTKRELIRERLREHWVWMFETEIHSQLETRERLLFILLPFAVVLIISEVLIPKLFAFLFG